MPPIYPNTPISTPYHLFPLDYLQTFLSKAISYEFEGHVVKFKGILLKGSPGAITLD